MIHYVDAEADFHRVFDGEIIRIAQRLREEGRIRHIGMSSHNPAVARMAVETGLVDVLMFSVNPCYDLQPAGDDVDALWAEESYAGTLHNIDPDRERLYELCERSGVGIDVMKVYGGGDLLSEENSPFGKAMTPVQCIEYALTRPGVASVMVGCRTQDEIRAALDWCGASPAERDYASAMAGMERFTWEGHCMYCGHCRPLYGGNRHRSGQQIPQPRRGAGRNPGNRARTLRRAHAPRFGMHRLRRVRNALPVRRGDRRVDAPRGGTIRLLTANPEKDETRQRKQGPGRP